MANSWTDANLRNHVSRSNNNNNRMDTFNQALTFESYATNEYSPYILKELYNSPNIKYNEFDNDKFDKYNDVLQDKAPKYSFGTLHSNKPMYDAYYAFGKIYLYQLILACNNISTLLDYDDNNFKKILVPTSQNIQEMFKNLLHDKHFKSIKELTKVEDIEEIIKLVIINSEIDYTIVDAIHEKLNISYAKLNKRLQSPLIIKYLSRQLYQIINRITDEDEIVVDEELLTNTLNSILKKTTKYIMNTSLD